MTLRDASLKETPPFQASKWLKTQVLLDAHEMEMLLEQLQKASFYQVSGVCQAGQEKLEKHVFLQKYREYIDALKRGESLPEADYRTFFSLAITLTPEALRAVPVDAGRLLVRVVQPVIQMQPHSMDYSMPDKKFHSMVYGSESVSWGVQFSYPQIFQDSFTKKIFSVKESPEFPNTALFKQLQRWIRHNTIPIPFLLMGERINIPVRIGKECLSWINHHPDLKRKKLEVV